MSSSKFEIDVGYISLENTQWWVDDLECDREKGFIVFALCVTQFYGLMRLRLCLQVQRFVYCTLSYHFHLCRSHGTENWTWNSKKLYLIQVYSSVVCGFKDDLLDIFSVFGKDNSPVLSFKSFVWKCSGIVVKI